MGGRPVMRQILEDPPFDPTPLALEDRQLFDSLLGAFSREELGLMADHPTTVSEDLLVDLVGERDD